MIHNVGVMKLTPLPSSSTAERWLSRRDNLVVLRLGIVKFFPFGINLRCRNFEKMIYCSCFEVRKVISNDT